MQGNLVFNNNRAQDHYNNNNIEKINSNNAVIKADQNNISSLKSNTIIHNRTLSTHNVMQINQKYD